MMYHFFLFMLCAQNTIQRILKLHLVNRSTLCPTTVKWVIKHINNQEDVHIEYALIFNVWPQYTSIDFVCWARLFVFLNSLATTRTGVLDYKITGGCIRKCEWCYVDFKLLGCFWVVGRWWLTSLNQKSPPPSLYNILVGSFLPCKSRLALANATNYANSLFNLRNSR